MDHEYGGAEVAIVERSEMKLFRKLAVLVLCLGLSFGAVDSFAQSIGISGRVLDERGRPVEDVSGTLYYPPCRGCIDHNLESFRSLPDGVFFVDSPGPPERGFRLYLEKRASDRFWSTLGFPPYDDLRHIPLFRGIPVRREKGSKSRQRFEMGDLKLKLYYGEVTIDLTRLLKEGYKPGRVASSWLHFTLRGLGKTIHDGQIPSVAFDSTFSFLNLALPTGRWYLRVALEEKEKTGAPRVIIDVNKTGKVEVTYPKAPPANRSSQTTQRRRSSARIS
jgi:hypothetical protein